MSTDKNYKPTTNIKGEFVRKDSQFRNRITADGSSGFKAEANRYHLYVSLACPWAHRTLIVRKLKGLEKVVSLNVVDWILGKEGWKFDPEKPGATPDTVNNFGHLSEVYALSDPEYDGRWTVPVLFDKVQKKIVCNDSAEIIRMLSPEFNEFCETVEQKELDLYPEGLRKEIDEMNDWVYPTINNGVYRSGFASSQEAYDSAVVILFEALEKLENILSTRRYLVGNRFTEADVRLFTTLIRFDLVYHGHFKCNKKRIIDYPNIWGYTRDIYQMPGVADTCNFEHITKHYMQSHRDINPHGIVAIGPDLDLKAPHGRETLGQ
ncbi:Glutathionyl-hydroquinone reductase [Paramuricea clavata]|uniref:Glutathionyl-hydroquinone reductase n=1 Tax=Paramuricea clavata TaxID=317549 RepID=A0A7D9EIL4_PARCT|nr:Glutathionyl-hydroquinone reductase [Paramuricea clavata]